MSILYIDKREVDKINRNNRISATKTTSTAASSNASNNLIFKNGLVNAGNVVQWSGEFDGNKYNELNQPIAELIGLSISGNTEIRGNFADFDVANNEYYSGTTALTVSGNTKIYGDLDVTGNVKASKDVIAYFKQQLTEDQLSILSVNYPLQKSGSTISLSYNTKQFELSGNSLTIKPSLLTGTTASVSWSQITDKPTTFTPAAHSIAVHSDFTTFFNANNKAKEAVNAEYASSASYASVANAVNWSSVQNKPNFATVATSGSYNDLTDKPTIGSNSIAGASDFSTYFTGTKANQALSADSVSWSNVSSKPTFATVATSGSYNDLTDKPVIYSTINSLTDRNSYFSGYQAISAQTADNAVNLNSIAGSNYYHSGNFNKSDVAIQASTLTAASDITGQFFKIKNSSGTVMWTVKVDAIYQKLLFTNSTTNVKVLIDQNGNLFSTGDITAFASI